MPAERLDHSNDPAIGGIPGPGHRLHAWTKIGYGAGAMVDGVTSNALNTFLLFYVTSVCGLPGALAGLALSAGLIVDAVLDPLIGSLSDGWHSRLGRRLPFMLLGLPLVLIAFALIFALPQGRSATGLFAMLMGLAIVLRVSVSVFNLPFLALGAELSDDYADRSRIAAWRWGFGMLGGLIAILVGFGGFFSGPKGLGDRLAYPPFALACCAIIAPGAAVAIWTTWSRRSRVHRDAGVREHWLASLLAGLGEIFRNRSFRILFIASVLFFMAQGVALSLGLHANTYFWRLSSSQVQLVTMALFVGLLGGAPVIGALAPLWPKKHLLIVSLFVAVAGQSLPATARLTGILPLAGDQLTWLLAANAMLGGVMLTAAAIAISSMLADAADEHEYLFGTRREGLYFAGWAFAGKAATAGGALIAGLVLQLGGFPSGAAARAGGHIVLSPATVTVLGLGYGPGAAVFSVAGLLVLLRYRLDRKAHRAILDELVQRRIAAATPG